MQILRYFFHVLNIRLIAADFAIMHIDFEIAFKYDYPGAFRVTQGDNLDTKTVVKNIFLYVQKTIVIIGLEKNSGAFRVLLQ